MEDRDIMFDLSTLHPLSSILHPLSSVFTLLQKLHEIFGGKLVQIRRILIGPVLPALMSPKPRLWVLPDNTFQDPVEHSGV